VKAPVDIALGDEEPVGKALLRWHEFLEQRGLSEEPTELLLGEPEGRADLEASDEPALEVMALPSAAGRAGVVAAPSSYLAASREKEALLAAVPPEPGRWRALGPFGIPNGQTYGTGPGSTTTVSGRVAAIAVDPGDSGHILVGTAAGGIWQTRDGGRTWAPRTDEQPTLSIGALAFDPSDPSKVYAGTGEGNSPYRNLGQGILVSRDGGTSWTVSARQVFAGIGFYRLVVDPRVGSRLFAATSGGAAISTNGGTSWSLLHRGLTWDVSVAYHGQELEILLAAQDGLFALRGSVRGSGFTRVDLPGLPLTLNPRAERMAVAHAPSDPGQAFAFAAARGRAYLWHSPSAQRGFVSVALPSFPIPAQPSIDVLDVRQAWYNWFVAVPPGSADVIYLGAFELVKGERVSQGWSWSDISSRAGQGDSIHPDQHAMAFDPQNPDVVYAGNDGGIFRSPDAGGSWQSLNDGLAISEIEYLTQRPDDPDWILAGLQDNGTIRRQGAPGWTQEALGDGGDCATNMANPGVCYHSYYGMSLERSDSRGDRDSWTRVTPPNSAREQFQQLFYPPLEVNGEVVVKAGEVVCISSNSGATWIKAALPPTAEGPSVASALAIPTTDRVLAGTMWGDVFRIDRHPQWSGNPTTLIRPRAGWISDLLVSSDMPHRYWATFSKPGAVFRSDDEGESWIEVTANLPSIPVNAIVNDPSNPDRVWVACDVGVFESRNAGGTWSVFGTGLPNVLAMDLVFYERDRLLRVGTRSRGIWEVSVS
jgi:photosystem II stability/assembly factor-like uncharacterized protein